MSFCNVVNKFHNEDSLADTSKYRVTSMSFCNVVNKFHNEDSLADTSTSKKTNLSSLSIRSKQVDDFNSSFKNLLSSSSFCKLWRWSVDCGKMLGVNRTSFINWFTNDIDNSSQGSRTYWNFDR